MPKLKKYAPPVDTIEADFLAAIKRLQDGKPTNKTLKIRAAEGKLKANPTTVSLEAGHSRTLIGKINCRYPRIRLELEKTKVDPNAVPTTYTELIGNLRTSKKSLAVQLNLYKSEVLEHFTARTKAEKAAALAHAAHARLVKELNEIGKVSKLVPKKKPN